jgi:hypothetical protein
MRGSRRLSQDCEKKSMPNTHDVTDEREAVGGEEGAGQQLNQILASGLPALYKKGIRLEEFMRCTLRLRSRRLPTLLLRFANSAS